MITYHHTCDYLCSHLYDVTADPLGSFTPEVEAAMNEARDARTRSAMLRKEVSGMVSRVGKVQEVTKGSVNSGLVGKIGETVQLKVNITYHYILHSYLYVLNLFGIIIF